MCSFQLKFSLIITPKKRIDETFSIVLFLKYTSNDVFETEQLLFLGVKSRYLVFAEFTVRSYYTFIYYCITIFITTLKVILSIVNFIPTIVQGKVQIPSPSLKIISNH